MIQPPQNLSSFEGLLEVVKALRSEHGCPWDKEQTHQSLAPFAIEEAHELAEAIERGNKSEMVSELGDLMLQVALHSEVASQNKDPQNRFEISDVLRSINEKMVRRHPHVFANETAKDANEVLENWAEIKRQEKASDGKIQDASFDIPPQLPALMRAQKIGSKTKAQKFDWDNADQVFAKIEEELAELKQAVLELRNKKSSAQSEVEAELGDVLFSCAQLARHLKCDAEQSLRIANQRFEKRFFKMFELARQRSEISQPPSRDELETLWSEVKALEKQESPEL